MSDYTGEIVVRQLGLVDYVTIYEKMQSFSATRDQSSQDECWLVQHSPVYTLGRNAKKHHLLSPGNIPVVQVDRGGQVTYHGPGQIILYLLLDIRRNNLGVRQVVTIMEKSLVAVLANWGINAYAKPEAPGVYVNEKKIASLGLRIKNGKSYHGLALNVDMDLSPFNGINPCGYEGLQVTQILNEANNVSDMALPIVAEKLVEILTTELSKVTNNE